MKLGIHSMVWVGAWSPDEARFAVESSARAGFDVIELAAADPLSFDVAMTAALLEEYGMEASASLGLDESTDVSSPDPAIVAAGRRRLQDALAIVRDTGGRYLCGVLYSKLGRYDAPPTAGDVERSQEAMAWLADLAAESGITIGLEFCNRYETNIINTTRQTLDYIAAVDRSNLVAHLDTYHMNIEETGMREPVLAAAAAGKLGYVHIGESHRGALGTGTVPWDDFFSGLLDSGYDGIVTFESFSSAVVHPSFSNALAIWRDTWTDNTGLARDAIEFLRQRLGR